MFHLPSLAHSVGSIRIRDLFIQLERVKKKQTERNSLSRNEGFIIEIAVLINFLGTISITDNNKLIFFVSKIYVFK